MTEIELRIDDGPYEFEITEDAGHITVDYRRRGDEMWETLLFTRDEFRVFDDFVYYLEGALYAAGRI